MQALLRRRIDPVYLVFMVGFIDGRHRTLRLFLCLEVAKRS